MKVLSALVLSLHKITTLLKELLNTITDKVWVRFYKTVLKLVHLLHEEKKKSLFD